MLVWQGIDGFCAKKTEICLGEIAALLQKSFWHDVF